MSRHRRGLSAAVVVWALLAGPGAAGDPARMLEVVDRHGARIAALPLAADGRWCLRWAHSVTGGAVADCFRVDGAGMVLEASFLHDFAAGLGNTPGEGRLRSAEGGGYWIEGIDRPLPRGTLPLRVGRAAVGHHVTSGAGRLDLSPIAPMRRVRIRPARGDAPADADRTSPPGG